MLQIILVTKEKWRSPSRPINILICSGNARRNLLELGKFWALVLGKWCFITCIYSKKGMVSRTSCNMQHESDLFFLVCLYTKFEQFWVCFEGGIYCRTNIWQKSPPSQLLLPWTPYVSTNLFLALNNYLSPFLFNLQFFKIESEIVKKVSASPRTNAFPLFSLMKIMRSLKIILIQSTSAPFEIIKGLS